MYRALCVAAVMALSGCALSPGQRLDLGDGWQSGQADLEQSVVVREITPKTIIQLEQAHQLNDRLPAALLDFRPDDYRISAGDALSITVWDHPELTTPAGQYVADPNSRLVRPDGTFYYPYLGNVMAAGFTPDRLRAQVAGQLTRFITSPQVDIAVSRYGSQRVFFTGAFLRSDPQTLTNVPLSLSEAIGKAGINLDQADLSGLRLRRDGEEYVLNLDALSRQGVDLQRVYLKHDDTLFLPFNDRKKVFVMGEVGLSKAITFKTEDISLADALGTVSGLRPETAKASDVYVIRQSKQSPDTGADVFRMNANSPVSWVMAGRFRLQPGDVVYVDTASIVRFNRVVSGLFPVSFLVQSARALTQ
ncbi:MAG: polysaccharide biosynthesis/export family protein [Pseudomonadota bacterium]